MEVEELLVFVVCAGGVAHCAQHGKDGREGRAFLAGTVEGDMEQWRGVDEAVDLGLFMYGFGGR